MAREIICIHVGGCGNRLGLDFWAALCREHGLGPDGSVVDGDPARLARVEVMFHRAGGDRYTPRAVMVDLEPGTLDLIRSSPMGTLFKPDNFVFGQSGTGNNWAKGHYTEGAELIDAVLDAIHRELDACESPQGVILFHALGGGTGSGLGTLILAKLRHDYPDLILASASVLPSARVSEVVVEPYNATLALGQLIEHADSCLVFDNERIHALARSMGVRRPRLADLNWLITQALCGATASLRFASHANADLRALATNLVPRPRLHFVHLAHFPLVTAGARGRVETSLREVSERLTDRRSSLSAEALGPTWAATPIYRGALDDAELHALVRREQASLAGQRVEWIPDGLTPARVDAPASDSNISATLLATCQGLAPVFERIRGQFARLYKRKAFVHWYTGEGMDEMELQEAERKLRELVAAYNDDQPSGGSKP